MTIIRTFTVTVTKEITVELPDMFATDFFIDEWRKGLWSIEGVEDIAEHAAVMAATGHSGLELDGLGLLAPAWSKYPRVPDVKFTVNYEDTETEPKA